MKAKILIIDDQKSIRLIIKEFLLKEGYDVLDTEKQLTPSFVSLYSYAI